MVLSELKVGDRAKIVKLNVENREIRRHLLDMGLTRGVEVKVKKIDKAKNTSMIEITIHEGKNHEIKKMFEYFNLDVLKLTRKEYGNLRLDNLPSGKYRKLTIHEVKSLYSLIKK